MANFLIIASDIPPLEGEAMRAPEVYKLMMDHGCWEFPPAAPHLDRLKKGDTLLFYLGGNHARYFAGEAVVAGEFEEIGKKSATTFDREKIPFFRFRLPLTKIERYPPEATNLDDMMDLSFAREKEVTRPYIGLLLRVGLRKLTDEDVQLLRKRARRKLARS